MHELKSAGRSPALPLAIELPGGTLRLHSLLRVLPGQRYVGAADWQGRRVLAKLLVGGKAAREFARETAGARLLAEQCLDSPALLASGLSEEGGWLLFEFLDAAESLGSAWQALAAAPAAAPERRVLLGRALQAIGQLHAVGLWQDDLHLDNLLRQGEQLYLIDAGSIRTATPGQPLARAQALENLAVFFAQLPAEFEALIEPLLADYRRGNPHGGALSAADLRAPIARMRRWRLKDYLKKLGRDCTLFAAQHDACGLRVMRREEAPLLAPLLADPDAAIAAGQSLKLGGSATVARIEQDGRLLVIKRYNLKNTLHWLKRCWRPSRAWHSWVEGNRLAFLGIATPKPLAVREERRFGLRGRAWLITEHAGTEDILTRFAAYRQGTPPEAELLALEQLFAALQRERISHGDLKGTNLLWQDGQWALIDLDALRAHRCPRRFARAHARDRARFLRNWPADSPLYRLLDQRLPQVPGTCPKR
nr:lipopolysaccharide kinase InaA family protein [Pseudomonas sp. NW5]